MYPPFQDPFTIKSSSARPKPKQVRTGGAYTTYSEERLPMPLFVKYIIEFIHRTAKWWVLAGIILLGLAIVAFCVWLFLIGQAMWLVIPLVLLFFWSIAW